MTIEKYKARVEELKDTPEMTLQEKLADLEIDYQYICNMNTELSKKYQELMDCFPTSRELEYLLEYFFDTGIDFATETFLVSGYDQETHNKRKAKLIKFKSALVALEKQDVNVIPPKYNDIDKEGQ